MESERDAGFNLERCFPSAGQIVMAETDYML